jgi:hypothetical protein
VRLSPTPVHLELDQPILESTRIVLRTVEFGPRGPEVGLDPLVEMPDVFELRTMRHRRFLRPESQFGL